MWNIHLICNLLKSGNNVPADICWRLYNSSRILVSNTIRCLSCRIVLYSSRAIMFSPQLFKAFTIILLYRTFVHGATQSFTRRSFSLDTHCSASCFPVCLLRNTKQGKRLFPRTRSSVTTQSQTKGSSPGQIESLLSSSAQPNALKRWPRAYYKAFSWFLPELWADSRRSFPRT